MPVRTYTAVDILNWVLGAPAFTGTSTPNVTSSAGAISADSTDSDTDTGGVSAAAGVEQTGFVLATGNFDYDAFPAIPDNALITRVKLTGFGLSGNVAATASVSGTDVPPISDYLIEIGSVGNTAATAGSSAAIGGLSVSGEASFAFQQVGQQGSTDSITDSGTNSVTDIDELDLSGAPITKAQLAATYNLLAVGVSVNVESGAQVNDVDNDANASASMNWSAAVGSIQFEVTYEEGPFTITLNPSGGNVESGQQIAVTSPDVDVQTLNYAAIQNDKVIPLKISPAGNLTIPDPSPDPCTDCLGDCPECDDCVTACSEDLNSEACQECLQSCLDCLGTCLENLEAAEECQDSTQDPPGAVPITIICSDGTQFGGSVPLGNFVILLTNGSGIYRLIPGQAKDVLYSSTRDGSTYDVKIPNPFAKTGFFRS